MRFQFGVFIDRAKFDRGPFFFLDVVLERFAARGHSVHWITPDTPVPADLDAGMLHVAATKVPARVRRKIPAELPVLNRRVLDISKRSVSSMLVGEHDSIGGPVIVKSDANFAGRNDFERSGPIHRRLARLAHRLQQRLGSVESVPYEIYDSIAHVPRAVWRMSDRVVERFIPEREGELYVLRKWVFLGDVDVQVISHAENPVIKANASRNVFVTEPVPAELMAERRRLGFDYGKFDYVRHAGKAVLLDANSTPGITRRTPDLIAHADELAAGLETWIRRSGRTLATDRVMACGPA